MRRLLATLLLVLGTWIGSAWAGPTQAAARPNILFVLTDDLDRASLGAMPTVQALARAGTTLNRFYVTTPMCGPSRATILTGLYPQNTGVRSNRLPSGGYQTFVAHGLEQRTVAIWLQAAGYRTALIGKYLNWYPEGAAPLHVPPGWSRWQVPVDEANMVLKYDYRLNEDGRETAYGHAATDYAIDVYAGKARRFVAEAADAGAPFALFLWFPSPHTPEEPAPRHAALYPYAKAARSPSFPELDTTDKPPHMRLTLDDAMAGEIDRRHRLRLRMLRSIDEAMASLQALLRERGLLERTYIVFTSDNGWHEGQHNQSPMKGRPYEEDIRVPMVVAGPGIPAGRYLGRLVGNADLAPTMAAWASVPVPVEVDGRSFADLLAARNPYALPWRKRLPIMRAIEGKRAAASWPAFALPPTPSRGYRCLDGLARKPVPWPEFRGLRDERMTYVEHVTGDMEVYDNQADPYQLENLICSLPAAMRETLHRATLELFTCRGQDCRTTEDR